VDGNKRTAAACCETSLELNGATLEADDLDLFPVYLALAEGKLAERDFAAWLRDRLQLTPDRKAHEPSKPYRAKPRGTRPRTSGTTRSAR
jgi:death-on-curing protein